MIKNILFVTAVNSRKAGGLFFTITSLVNKLIKKFDNTICVLGYYDKYSLEDIKSFDRSIELIEYNVENNILGKIGYSRNLKGKLRSSKPDVIHQQGIWMYYSSEVFNYKMKTNVKVIIQPHGMLDSWALKNSYLKKKIASMLYEKKNLRTADCFHALNYEEYKAIRNYGIKQPVAIIPNGIDIIFSSIELEENHKKKSLKKKKLLYLGRIHPKKGIELLVEAVKNIINNDSDIFDDWVIQIAGWDQSGHQKFLENKIKELKVSAYFEFLGPAFGQMKQDFFLDASGFILPSYSEGLPMTILEAWSYGLPVIMTSSCNLEDGFTHEAAIEILNDSNDIAKNLIRFFTMNDHERYVMGKNGYKLVENKYTWDNVAKQTNELYEWVLNTSTVVPNFIILD